MEQLVLTQGMIASGIVLAVTFIGIFTEQLHGMERSKVASAGALTMVIVGQIYGFYSPMEAVEAVKDAKMVLFLGRGVSAPVAREGALKLMEVAYIPCLAYPAAEMKHGPIALLEPGSPVVVIAPNDALKEKTRSNIQECRARGAKIILIHEEGDDIAEEADISISVPITTPLLSPLLMVVPLQLLAYHTAVIKGTDIDQPRNLAKSVTVE